MEKTYWLDMVAGAFSTNPLYLDKTRQFYMDKIMNTPDDNTVAAARAKALVRVYRMATSSALINQQAITRPLLELGEKYSRNGVWVRL